VPLKATIFVTVLGMSLGTSPRANTGTSGTDHGSNHQNLGAGSRASVTLTAYRADRGRIFSHEHLRRVLAGKLGCDEDLKLAEGENGPVRRQRPAAETSGVIVDEAQRAELLREAAQHTLAGGEEGSRPDEHSSQRRCWPHGGRQLSWFDHGRS
jgi:hypothetical protein